MIPVCHCPFYLFQIFFFPVQPSVRCIRLGHQITLQGITPPEYFCHHQVQMHVEIIPETALSFSEQIFVKKQSTFYPCLFQIVQKMPSQQSNAVLIFLQRFRRNQIAQNAAAAPAESALSAVQSLFNQLPHRPVSLLLRSAVVQHHTMHHTTFLKRRPVSVTAVIQLYHSPHLLPDILLFRLFSPFRAAASSCKIEHTSSSSTGFVR